MTTSQNTDGNLTSLHLKELMKGYLTVGETDYKKGYDQGRAENNLILTHLQIQADDVYRFANHPTHPATLGGSVQCDRLWGNAPVEQGFFNLFVDTACPMEKRMKYRLFFKDSTGPLTFSGFKAINDDNRHGIWHDCSVLFSRLYRGHITPEEEPAAEIYAAGIIFLFKGDFLAENVRSFRIRGPRCICGFFTFFRFFLGTIWHFAWAKFRGGAQP